MLHKLGGELNDPEKYYNREITSAFFSGDEDGHPDRLHLVFADGTKISISDHGQSCCESRYMTCDDKVETLIGGTLLRIEGKEGKTVEEECSEHETCFVEVATDKGFITITNHNEHSGYYGGFSLAIQEE